MTTTTHLIISFIIFFVLLAFLVYKYGSLKVSKMSLNDITALDVWGDILNPNDLEQAKNTRISYLQHMLEQPALLTIDALEQAIEIEKRGNTGTQDDIVDALKGVIQQAKSIQEQEEDELYSWGNIETETYKNYEIHNLWIQKDLPDYLL